MKTLFLILAVLWTTTSFGYDVRLLTPEQIKSLSKEDQVRYLRGVQRILAGMVQKTPYMADQMKKNSRMPSSDEEFQRLWDEQMAQEAGTTAVGSPDVINQLKSEATQTPAKSSPVTDSNVTSTPLPPMDSKPTPSTPNGTTTTTVTPTPSTPSGTTTTTTTPTPSGPTKNPTYKAVKNAQGGIDYVEVEGSKEELRHMFPNGKDKSKSSKTTSNKDPKPVTKPNDPSLLDANESYETSDNGKTAKPSSSTSAPKANEAKESNSKADGNETAKSQTTAKKEDNKSAQAQKVEDRKPSKQEEGQPEIHIERKHFRCMYSGWVVDGPDCKGPQKIPDWLAIDGMSESNKSCPAGSVVCMPLIFGLQMPQECKTYQQNGCAQKAKPLCVKRGAWPTIDCYRMAGNNNSRATRIALELITEVVPHQYARYQSLFADLCDEEQIKTNPFADKFKGRPRSKAQAKRIRDDISKTCEWASKQIEDLNSMHSIDKLTGDGKVKPIPARETRDPRSKGRR